jgi:hypothetical protein
MLPLASTKLSLIESLRDDDAPDVDHEEQLEDDQTGDGADAEGAVQEQQSDADHGDDAEARDALGADGAPQHLVVGLP